mgnify:CR=1 FL=1
MVWLDVGAAGFGDVGQDQAGDARRQASEQGARDADAEPVGAPVRPVAGIVRREVGRLPRREVVEGLGVPLDPGPAGKGGPSWTAMKEGNVMVF